MTKLQVVECYDAAKFVAVAVNAELVEVDESFAAAVGNDKALAVVDYL